MAYRQVLNSKSILAPIFRDKYTHLKDRKKSHVLGNMNHGEF